jgi:hypothetical protein
LIILRLKYKIEMEYIGKQISIKRSENELSIVILSFKNKMKNTLLFLWLFLWTICGIVVFAEYFILTDSNSRAFIIVWIGFWVYFEYKIAKAYMWRKYGKEKIKIRDGKLLYKRDVSGKGKVKIYEIDFIKDFRMVEKKEDSFFENLNNSYWAVAGEKLEFDYYGKDIKFGIQLEETDAKALFNKIKKEIK